MRSESLSLGLVLERRRVDHPWQDHAWRPVAVFPGDPEGEPWRILREGEVTSPHAPPFEHQAEGKAFAPHADALVSGLTIPSARARSSGLLTLKKGSTGRQGKSTWTRL